MYFAYVSGIAFILIGIYLSYRRRRVHPLLLLSISALSFSWIESPYDWAMYAQFPPGLPRMPSWWPLNVTWGGLPSAVPIGYVSYFVLPALIGAALGRWLSAKFHWRRPTTLLTVGLVVGFGWAFVFNAITGAHFGNFYYGYVIPGLAIFEGTKNQYPLYDSLAMGIEMMVFTYLLGRTDAGGPQRHRDVVRQQGENSRTVVGPVDRRRCRCRTSCLRRSLRAAPDYETRRLGDRRTRRTALPGHAQPAPLAEGRS